MIEVPLRYVDLDLDLAVLDATGATYAGTAGDLAVRVTLTVDEWERRDRPTSIPVTLDLGDNE